MFNVEIPHIGTIIIRVDNTAQTPHGIQATPLLKLHKSKDQAKKKKMTELERLHAELVIKNTEFRRSMAKMDCSQVGLPRFLDQNEMSQPSNGRIT